MSTANYSQALLSAYPPSEAVAVVRSRLDESHSLNEKLVEWVTQRAIIEEEYANSLERLLSHNAIDPSLLNTLSAPWQQAIALTEEEAKSANTYSSILRTAVQVPLERSTSEKSRGYKEIRAQQTDLSHLAKRLKEKEDEFQKRRGHTGLKSERAEIEFAELRSQWENQAPVVLDQFQQSDTQRIVFLKEALAKIFTSSADKYQKNLSFSETGVMKVLDYEPSTETDAFIHLISTRAANRTISNTADDSSSIVDSLYSHSRVAGSIANHSVASNEDSLGDLPSGHGGHIGQRTKLRSKVGSIFKRNKGKKEEDKETKLSPEQRIDRMNQRERERQAQRQSSIASHGSHATTESHPRTGILPQPVGVVNKRDSALFARPPPSASPVPSPTVDHSSVKPSSAKTFELPSSPTSASAAPPAPPPSRKVHESGVLSHPSSFASTSSHDNNGSNNGQALGEPNASEARRESTSSTTTSDDAPLKINIRSDTIAEERTAAESALSSLSSTLRARPTVSGRANRGRRDIQSTLFTNISPAEVDTTGTSGSHAQPPTIPEDSGSLTSQSTGTGQDIFGTPTSRSAPHADTRSLKSLQSTATGTSGKSPHSELQVSPEYPFAASVVERITANIKDGVVISSSTSGEIAVANFDKSKSAVYVRFSYPQTTSLSIAPNLTFVKEISQSVYRLETTHLHTGPTVALKYARNPSPEPPLIITPVWRHEATQSSLMLHYKLNQDFSAYPVELRDVVVSVAIEGAIATSAQSKPAASFNHEAQRITWRFEGDDTLILKPGVEERWLCRFITQGFAKEAASGVSVKFKIIDSVVPFSLDYRYLAPDGENDDVPLSQVQSDWKSTPTNTALISTDYRASSEKNVQRLGQ